MLFMFRTFRLHPKWWLAGNFYLRFIFLLEIKSMEDVAVHKGHELCGVCFHLGLQESSVMSLGLLIPWPGDISNPKETVEMHVSGLHPLRPTQQRGGSWLWPNPLRQAPNTASKDCHPVIVVNPTNREAGQFLLAHLATCRNRQQEELPVPQP